MIERTEVYDLGELDTNSSPRRPAAVGPPSPRERTRESRTEIRPAPARRESGFNLWGSMSLFVPGSGQLVRGDFARGLFFMASLGFLVTLSWAVLATMPRLAATFEVLGYPRASPVWILAGLYAVAGLLHLGSAMTANPPWEFSKVRSAVHPAVAGAASLIFPGWGQILNGDRRRAALFIALVWLTAAAWILVSSPAQQLLQGLGLYLPEPLSAMTTPIVRWTLPAVVWSIAVYDAVSRAIAHR